ncbi:chordin-like [Mercenaria mercenaria]|uniref:chordin-like n=1 Tax=Mercenaria mercenaria TaxID=6596 RepID=UPI00234EB35F|nr:chordin-like [Mercenaria mercenaria]
MIVCAFNWRYLDDFAGCWLGNQFYMVGDRWSPSINPHGLMVVKHHRVQLEGRVLCTNIKRECPKPKCATPILRPNTCCKICPGQDTSYEDQFNTVDTATSTNPVLTERSLPEKDMSALLVGGGRQKHGGRTVRTRAVAMVHITNITEDSFNYAVRYSRLKDPVYFKITDEYGNPVIERKIPRQQSRSGMIYDKVENIPKNYVKYILQNNAYITITTTRHKRGEIHGYLRTNTIAAIASFEALLNPPDKSGIGALVTMFYDVTTKMASFVIQVDGFRHSKIISDEYFVSFEKDTEIIHQHILRVSHQKYQMVGKVSVDSKMSKQIARGRLHVRVTSRSGATMVGQLRPRLLRTDMIGTFATTNRSAGYVLMTLEDDGSLKYKVSFHLPHSASINIVLQRQIKNNASWKDFAKLLEETEHYNEPRFEAEGSFKKLRARDIVFIQNAGVRIRITINNEDIYTRVYPLQRKTDFLFKASDRMLRSTYCESPAFVFYDVSKNCSDLSYYVISSGARDETLDMTFTIETRNAGSFIRKLEKPMGTITGIGDGVYRDINHGKATARLRVSGDVCEQYEGKIRIRNNCWKKSFPQTTTGSVIDSQENGLEIDRFDTFRCYYEGQFYAHAQSWIPADDNPCVTCRCNRGKVHCDRMICPPTSCKYPIKREDECCPVCNDDNDTEKKHSGSCYFEGDKRWHLAGSYWHPFVPPFGYSKCAICNCVQSTLEVNCTRVPCPALNCPKHQRIRVKPDDCCQVCRGRNDAAVSFDDIFLKTKRKGKEGCTFGGGLFQHGDKWHPVLHPFGEMKCYTCSCKNGKARCRKQRCQPLDCKHQYRPSGECCPACTEKKSRQKGSNEILV